MIGKFLFMAGVAAVLGGCGADTPTGPPGNNLPNGTFTALIDGIGYSPVAAVVTVTDEFMSVTATAAGGLSAFTITVVGNSVGTYSIGPNTPHSALHAYPSGSAWLANQSMGSGNITVTTYEETRIAGTFSFILAPEPGGSAISPKRVTLGVFDVTFEP